MWFTRSVQRATTALLCGGLIDAALAERAQPNMAVQTLVPQVDPTNINVVTGIGVSYPAASTTYKSSGSINSKEGSETEVSSLYTTTTTIRSTSTGTDMVESSVSRALTSSSALPLQLEADSTAAATITVTPTPTASEASSGHHPFTPNAGRSRRFEESKSAAMATTTLRKKKTTGRATPYPCINFRCLPFDLDPPEREKDERDSGSGTEMHKMIIMLGAAALALAVQAVMVRVAGPAARPQ